MYDSLSFIDTNDFEISSTRGFLPEEDPLWGMGGDFAAWENLAQELPKALVSTKLRDWVKNLPECPVYLLKSKAELERAMLTLSYIGHAYVWADKNIPQSIPASLAVPWHEAAKRLGRPPVLSYASYALHNWKRIDGNDGIELGNIALLQNFLGGADEEWFILVHIDIEAKAAPAINEIPQILEAAATNNPEALAMSLTTVAAALHSIQNTMDRMGEYCDPYIYYNRVRPYIHGWKDNPALPNGLIYEGVEEYAGLPQQFRGETGAQSGIIPSLDAMLGIGHKDDPLKRYLIEMRNYMPPLHRQFLEAVEAGPNVREFVIQNKTGYPNLKRVYNECVAAIDKFRTTHLSFASSYIDKQKQSSDANPTKVGTGGTPFMTYLAKHRDESSQHLL